MIRPSPFVTFPARHATFLPLALLLSLRSLLRGSISLRILMGMKNSLLEYLRPLSEDPLCGENGHDFCACIYLCHFFSFYTGSGYVRHAIEALHMPTIMAAHLRPSPPMRLGWRPHQVR